MLLACLSFRLSLYVCVSGLVHEIDGETEGSGPQGGVFMSLLVFEYGSIFRLESHAGTVAARALSVRRSSRPCAVRCS